MWLLALLAFGSGVTARNECLTFYDDLCTGWYGNSGCQCTFGEKCGTVGYNVSQILKDDPSATCESRKGTCYNVVVGQCPGPANCKTYFDKCSATPEPLPQGPTPGIFGVDMSTSIDESGFSCLKQEGVTWMSARVQHSTGSIDTEGIQNIKNARSAGGLSLNGYLFPCVPCGNPAGQVNATVDALHKAGVLSSMKRIYLDVEPYQWPNDPKGNEQFITSMVDAAIKANHTYGIQWGIYGSWRGWESIFGGKDGYKYPSQQGWPVWYALYNGELNYDDFEAFGGWTQPERKQFYGDAYQCGLDVDLSWEKK